MKSKIMKVKVFYHRCTKVNLWVESYYTSGSYRVFSWSHMPKTVRNFIQGHDFRREDTPAYFVEIYEVGHDKLQKPSD